MKGIVDGVNYFRNERESSSEFQLQKEYIYDNFYVNKTKKYCNKGGRSSEGLVPFFDLHAGNNGYIIAIGWTGNWQIEFSSKDDIVTFQAGLQSPRFYLKPGEKLRTSSILIMEYTEAEDRHNKFRKLIKNKFFHKACANTRKENIFAVEFWGSVSSDEMIKRINAFKEHNINFEEVWLDAGWYGNDPAGSLFGGNWSSSVGDWNVNSAIHPNGLKDVCNSANDTGMKLMLWIEPERATKERIVAKEHPDWFLRSFDEDGNASDDLLLYYGNECALNYAYSVISGYVETLNLSCYRQDFNISPEKYFKQNDGTDRKGITEIKHIMGLYRLLDRLIENYPDLIIDNCATGGRRIDIEMLTRSLPLCISDYQCNFLPNADIFQIQSSNISRYLPYHGCFTKAIGDTYTLRSTFTSSLGCSVNAAGFQTMKESDYIWLKKNLDEYKRIQKYFSCNYYNLCSVEFDGTSWTVWQFHDEKKDCGVVMAFRRKSSPFDRMRIKLNGMKEGRLYSFENFDNKCTFLSDGNIELFLEEPRSSLIMEYKLEN